MLAITRIPRMSAHTHFLQGQYLIFGRGPRRRHGRQHGRLVLRPQDHVQPALRLQLGQDRCDVVFHSPARSREFVCNRRIALAVDKQAQHGLLLCGQSIGMLLRRAVLSAFKLRQFIFPGHHAHAGPQALAGGLRPDIAEDAVGLLKERTVP